MPKPSKEERAAYHQAIGFWHHLVRAYKLTKEMYFKMNDDCFGLCMCCGQPARKKKRLVVDHDHGTGRIRGLLCYACNTMLTRRLGQSWFFGWFVHYNKAPVDFLLEGP